MTRLATMFFVIALIAALFAFGGFATAAAEEQHLRDFGALALAVACYAAAGIGSRDVST